MSTAPVVQIPSVLSISEGTAAASTAPRNPGANRNVAKAQQSVAVAHWYWTGRNLLSQSPPQAKPRRLPVPGLNSSARLGGGVVSELALRVSLAGLVLQSTFTSIPDLGSELYPWLPVRWLTRIRYATQTKLPRLKIPVLVMHSRADTLIPFGHGQKNFAAAQDPKMFWELKGDHNEALEVDRPGFRKGLQKFLKSLDPTPGRKRL